MKMRRAWRSLVDRAFRKIGCRKRNCGKRDCAKKPRVKVSFMEAQISTASVPARKWSPSSDASDIVKSVHAMLHPRNIVLVGATDKPGNYAERIWINLIKHHFEVGLYPVTSMRETV